MLGDRFPAKDMVVKGQDIGIDAGYLELANAIVIKAAEDYRSARHRTVFRDKYEERKNEGYIKSIERFFKSSYGDLICRGNAEYILDGLQAEFE